MSYTTKNIRNVALLGHSGSGKTTLAETMLFESGTIHRMGNIADKNTISDYNEIEKDKGKSVFSSIMALDWRGYRINVIDTPGTLDYVGDVVGALKIAATAIYVVDSHYGVQVGTERLWQYGLKYQKPSLFVVNKVDDENSSFDETIEQIREKFGREAVVVQYPYNEGLGFNAIIDVLKMTMYEFPPEGGKPEKKPIPESEKARADELHNELIETIAENDETLMDRYFEKGSLDEDEMREGLRLAMVNHQVFPIFCTSATRNMGTGRLMGFLDNVAPSPLDAEGLPTVEETRWKMDTEGKTIIYLFKDHLEPHVGDLMYFQVINGTVKVGQDLVNQSNEQAFRVGNMFTTVGNKRTEVTELKTGDIGALVKLKDANVGDTLTEKGENTKLKPIKYPDPLIRMAIKPERNGDEEKLAQALHQLQHEDPSLRIENSQELHQMIVHAQGEEHLGVVKYFLEHRYKLPIEFYEPGVAYRETISQSVRVSYKHKRQTGGAGQYAEVHFLIEPWEENMPAPDNMSVRNVQEIDLPWGGKLVFQNCIVGGVIDNRFMPAILKGIMEKMENGPVVGGFVRDVRVSVFDGSMHSVDSNDMAFKTAALMAFRNGFLEAKPKLLEPVYEVKILVPEEKMGDVFGDLNTRRAQILGMDLKDGYQEISAIVPLAELHRYSTFLKSISQGLATYSMEFARYQEVPFDVQQRIAKEVGEEVEA